MTMTADVMCPHWGWGAFVAEREILYSSRLQILFHFNNASIHPNTHILRIGYLLGN